MNICFITGSRADYGLLSNLMRYFKHDKSYNLQILATGSHLEKDYGHTYREIIKDGFIITKKINIRLKASQKKSISYPISIGIKKFSQVFKSLKPNLIVLLGDRYEIFAASCAAYVDQIPVCHLHGGELTRGSLDDTFRHCITKMSQFHFVAHKKYEKRVKQLGENPSNIFMVGGFGVDLIKKLYKLNKNQLEKKLKIEFEKKNILVTYHPETIKGFDNKKNFNEILNALKNLKNTKIIFTYANADNEGNLINSMINKFVKKNQSKCYIFKSMGYKYYLSILKYIDVCLGNSSSGLLEAPSYKIATINIGERQSDRLKAISVIDCKPKAKFIVEALNKIKNKDFKKKLYKCSNPYGNGGASYKTYKIIKKINLKNNLNKKFYDF